MGNVCCSGQKDLEQELKIQNKEDLSITLNSKQSQQIKNNISTNTNVQQNNDNKSQISLNENNQDNVQNIQKNISQNQNQEKISLNNKQQSENKENNGSHIENQTEQQSQINTVNTKREEIDILQEYTYYKDIKSTYFKNEGNQIKYKFQKTNYVSSQQISEVKNGISYKVLQFEKCKTICSDISFDTQDKQSQFNCVEFEIKNVQKKQDTKQEILVGVIQDEQQDFWKPLGRYGCNINLLNFINNSQMKVSGIQLSDTNQINEEYQKVLLIFDKQGCNFYVIINNEKQIMYECVKNKKLTLQGKWRFVMVFDNVQCEVNLLNSM